MIFITDNDTVAIVLLNWNGHDDTIECLNSLKNLNYPHYKIILVDNNSKKISKQTIIQYLSNQNYYKYDMIDKKALDDYELDTSTNLLFILNDKNQGFAGGNNVALKYLIKNQITDYVLLLNNDTTVSPNLLDGLAEKIKEDERYGFVGAVHYYYHDKNKIQTVGGGKIDVTHSECMAITQKNTKYFDFITGSCIFLSTSLLKQIGPLPEEYFMYWEDVDWSTKTREHGYMLTTSDYGCIYHKEGASIKSLSRIYYHTRNRIWYKRKYSTKAQYYKFLIYITCFVLKESLTNILKDKKYSKTLIKGWTDALR